MTNQSQQTPEEQLGLGESEYLRLTEDELALVLLGLSLPRIAGYEFPKDMTKTALDAAKNTLRARGGALLDDSGRVVIDEQIGQYVASMARFARLIMITLKMQGDLFERNWIALGNGAPMLHSIPEAGIHQFQTIPDPISMMLVISGLLRLSLEETALPGDDSFTLDLKFFDDADDLRDEKGGDELYRRLIDAKLPEAFALAAKQPTLNAAVSIMWPLTDGSAEGEDVPFAERGFWLWGVPQGYWMLTPDVATRQMKVTPVNPQMILNIIGEFLTEDLPN